MESLRGLPIEVAPTRGWLSRLIGSSGLFNQAVSYYARWFRDLVWPPKTLAAARAMRGWLAPIQVNARCGLPAVAWLPSAGSESAGDPKAPSSLHEAFAHRERELEERWGHLGRPRTAERSEDPAVRLRELSAWSALVDANLDAADALGDAIASATARLPALVVPMIFCVFVTVVFVGTRVQAAVLPALGLEALILGACGAGALAAFVALRGVIRRTDPRVPVLVSAAASLDSGAPARLAAIAAGIALNPPSTCAYPDDLIAAFRDRGLDPVPLAGLLVAADRDELPAPARTVLVDLLYRRALELEHARLAREVARWVALKELIPLAAVAAIGAVLLAILAQAFVPALSVLQSR